ncbi:uncharacterized protein EV420DRAFT_1696592 [Desarmillaria tabescens]|uniref:Uncharacterized protein n=1 Tax=Armillaria tabescens TaxID=1929756 RepID=A0AA39N1H6_ARMTA|nr:uncharacterized protein EV420DRAFT_1696592 [Desarmillaria tabescens]KAK0454038.1 hypothetical protein EV420DRAFT_1696592 [Desarmillaria tabescens]
MTARVDIPSDLTDDDKAYCFQLLDANLNSQILYALLHGVYTGVLAITLWNIFINNCWRTRRALIIVIVLLYALITINVAASWSDIYSAFIENGQSFWTVYLRLYGWDAAYWETGISALISTILADLYMIWCCWILWGRRRLTVLLPILCLISAVVSRIVFEIFQKYSNAPSEIFVTLYISFGLATTIWCTLLIIYRILTVVGVRRGAEGRLRVYHRFIQVFVESSALYAIAQLLYLAFSIRNNMGTFYFDTIAAIAKGVTPTLLVGRAAAGHTQPHDDSGESTVSTLHFQTYSEPGTISFQESTTEHDP